MAVGNCSQGLFGRDDDHGKGQHGKRRRRPEHGGLTENQAPSQGRIEIPPNEQNEKSDAEQPEDDGGHSGEVVHRSAYYPGRLPSPAYSTRYMAAPTPKGNTITSINIVTEIVPKMAGKIPPRDIPSTGHASWRIGTGTACGGDRVKGKDEPAETT